ncbi:MAG: FtsX-like permease family protein, partial [Cyanobacteria bacterium P01_A01_bin.83]
LTHAESIEREQIYQASQPSGIVLKFGTIVGFIVGLIILYQVLYVDVSDRLPEYATLKAIGYSDKYFIFVVLQEVVILSLIGFLPGFLISLWLYQLLATLTQIQLIMRSSVVINVFILSMVMCCISGFLATGILRSADPADVF